MTAPPTGLTGVVVRGMTLAGGGWFFGQVLNLGIYLILARLATPTDFGQLAAGAILVVFGGLIVESGMAAALIQRRDRIEEASNTALIATLVAGLVLSLAALAAAPLIGLLFGSREVAYVAAAASGWIFLRAATVVPDALMQRRFNFLRRLVVEPLGIVVFGASAIATVAAGLGVWGLVIGNTAQQLVMLVAAWALAGWRPRPRSASYALWREMVGYGRHVVVAEVIRRIGGRTRTALIGSFLGTANLGQYTYAQRISENPHGLVVYGVAYVLFPAFSRISDYPPRMRAAFLRALRGAALVGMPIGFVLVPLGIPLAVTLFGDQWRLAGEAAVAMSAYIGFRSLVSVCSEGCKALGEPRALVRLNGIAAVVSVAFAAAALPFGLIGVGVAISLSTIFTAALALRIFGRIAEIPVSVMMAGIAPALAAALIMAAGLFPLESFVIDAESREVGLALALLVGELGLAAGLYLAALRVIAPSTFEELIDILRSVWRRISRRRNDRAATNPS